MGGFRYKPLYVELTFVDDKVVSSEVSFRSEGTMDLKILFREILRVNWWMTSFGSSAELASGSAILVRQRMP